MNFRLSHRLVLDQIKRNRMVYRPTMIVGACLMAMVYIIFAMTHMIRLARFYGMRSLTTVFGAMSYLACVFVFFVFLYLNSLLLKRRKVNYGLYYVLGLQTRHLLLLNFWETLYLYVTMITGGLALGSLLSYLIYEILVFFMKQTKTAITFFISPRALADTALLFAGIYLIIFLYNAISIKRLHGIDLLRAPDQGEKEPRAKGWLALLSLLLLVVTYVVVNCVTAATTAVVIFLPAVLAVIVATYGIFIAGSVLILQALKRHKNIYYRPKAFFHISNLLFRMKENAAGLATICILFTCVFLTFSTTMTLYLGLDKVIDASLPMTLSTEERGQLIQDIYMDFGSLLFIGFYFIIFFLLVATLVVYFKQITEAANDRQRFITMQELGLSQAQVRSLINSQMLIMFFLPLGFSVLHVLASYKILWLLLAELTEKHLDRSFFMSVSLGSILIFALIYAGVYRSTSKLYYKVVRRELAA